MKTKIIIALMCAWMAMPHSQSASEIRILEAPCQKCGGDLAYSDGDTESTCQTCHEKYALVLLMLAGVVCVCAAGCYTVKKLKKLNGPGGRFNVTNRFGTNLLSALMDPQISMSVITGEASDVPYLLSLATVTNSSGRYVLEQSTNMIDWVELGRYADEDFLAVHESPIAGAFYRLKVNP